jgi:IclR family pca regulon transcriptional regulator
VNLIEKTFKCIEVLSGLAEGLTVSETASLTGLSRPATNRLLESLYEEGIVFRDGKTKRYRLGPRLYQWANVAMQATTPVNLARREIIGLCLETGSQCNFLVLNDIETVIVERCDLIDGVPVNRPVQTSPRPWYQTGTGKIIVAFYSPDARQRILERTYKQTALKPPPREVIEAELEAAQVRRYVVTPDHRVAGQSGVVVPIFDHTGYAVAAIGAYTRADTLEHEAGLALIASMTATASRISHYLGFEDTPGEA